MEQQQINKTPFDIISAQKDGISIEDISRDILDSQGINYKELFEDMDENGMLHPIMVREMNGKYRKWQAGGRRIIWAKSRGYTHISAYVLENQEDVDTIYEITYDESYK